MALNYWIASYPRSWADTGAWSLGIIPIDTHDVIFGSYGQGDVIGGFNQTGVDLASLWTQPEYGGNIGSAANSLLIDSATTWHEGSGLLSLKFDGGASTLTIDSPNRDQAAIIDGSVVGANIIVVKRGVVELAAGLSEIDSLAVSYRHSPGDDAIVTLPTSANKLATLSMSGGIVYNYRNIDDSTASQEGILSMLGGVVYMEGSATMDRGFVHGGTLFNNSTGQLADLEIHGGLVDANQKPGTRAMAIVKVYEGGSFAFSGQVTKTLLDFRNDAPRP